MCLEHIEPRYVEVICPIDDFRSFFIGKKQGILLLHIKKTKARVVQKNTVISQFKQGCIPLSCYKSLEHSI